MAEACKTCSESSECSGDACPAALKEMQKIKNVIAVMSGKGGVGKSSVTGLLAASLRKKGFSVGILDADVTGPSIPRLFGLKAGQLKNGGKGIIPARTSSGVEVVSINLLLPSEEEPVIWRGPIISGVIKQFWTEVEWSELDYLLVDLPPGTGDAPLTVMQTLPLNGVVVVTSPQSLVSMIVQKAINMANKMNIPILGLIENMAYLECPDCKKQIRLFGADITEEMAGKMGVPLLGQLPLEPRFVALCDKGQIEEFIGEASEINRVMEEIINIFSRVEQIN
ncbi:P-loop NTPase [Phosphitispora sp. TUW77]|uniref:P-loop NTPase n=1 Tax=Phosphitispora sp. TUW77 TaxID=3152361 RepID=UPI003AB35460